MHNAFLDPRHCRIYTGEQKQLARKQIEVLESAKRLLGAHHRVHNVDTLLNIALMLT